MNASHELRASLKRLEFLLFAQAPTRRAEGASILNALAVQLETRPHPEVVEALLRALTAVLGDILVDSRHDELLPEVTKILHLCRKDHAQPRIEPRRVDPEEMEEPDVSFSLGPRASEVVSLLRFKAGMSVDCICLLLKRYFGFNIPLADLRKIVLTLPASAHMP